MQIERVETYKIGGQTFSSPEKARAWLYDRIGETISKTLSDQGAGSIGPRERLAIVAAMTAQAETLSVLLEAYSAPVKD